MVPSVDTISLYQRCHAISFVASEWVFSGVKDADGGSGFDFYFNRAKNEAVVREPAGETLLVYRGCGNADDVRAVTLKRNGVLITVSQR